MAWRLVPPLIKPYPEFRHKLPTLLNSKAEIKQSEPSLALNVIVYRVTKTFKFITVLN